MYWVFRCWGDWYHPSDAVSMHYDCRGFVFLLTGSVLLVSALYCWFLSLLDEFSFTVCSDSAIYPSCENPVGLI